MSIKVGNLRGEKMMFPDGIGCCVWYPFSEEKDDVGICFDFLPEDIDDFIALLQELRDTEPELYEFTGEENEEMATG